ncbi:hypothetical protein [Heyndrickxia shackletonii]|nr:hypothetical protein [Heyndrickxia shackletonii]NEZ02367.1 hypothetical protein [Heyndrickxia shackletonii]
MKQIINSIQLHINELQDNVAHLKEINDNQFKLYDEALSIMDKMEGDK